MRKNVQIIAPAQMPFSVGNWDFQVLTVSPTVYGRSGLNEPYEYNELSYLGASAGGIISIDTRINEHGQRYGYATSSQEIRFESPSTTYSFNANKFGNQITYATNSPGAAVEARYWIFDDFPSGISLGMKAQGKSDVHQIDAAGAWCNVQINDKLIQYSSAETVSPAPKNKASQVIIRDTEKFSFLSNVNIYFSDCDVYRELPSGQIIKVDRHGSGNPTLASEYYLTPDKGYPTGLTTMTIKDGFSDATAVVEFDHDASKKEVTITIKSFTSRLCDIRDASYIIHAPNAICIAL